MNHVTGIPAIECRERPSRRVLERYIAPISSTKKPPTRVNCTPFVRQVLTNGVQFNAWGHTLEGKVFVLQSAEIRDHRTRGDSFQGIITERRASAIRGSDTLLFTEDGLRIDGLSPLTVGAFGFDFLGKEHGSSP